jgi:hypothetical protein
MSELLQIFENNLLPIFLAAGSGYLLGKFLDLDPRSISRVVFYIFSPCLVFRLITTSELDAGAILRMVGFASANMLSIVIIGLLLGWLWRLERSMLVAIILTTAFTNSGNFGLSLNQFAFGEPALAQASLFFITNAVMIYSLGVFIASLGQASPKEALVGLLKVPAVYGLLFAMLVVRMDWQLPLSIERTTTLLGDAAIPGMLVLLGLQLQKVQWTGKVGALSLTNTLRLLVAPAIAFLWSLAFNLEGPARQAGVLEASMPTAVMTTILATEYDVEPSFVTAVVFTTTLLSPLTLTPLVAILGG